MTEDTLSRAKKYARQIISEGRIRNHGLFLSTCIELIQASSDPEASELLGKLKKLEKVSSINDAEQCIGCGTTAPVTKVNYGKVTGLIIVDRLSQYGGLMCQQCNRALFRNCMIHCLIFGWWGLKALIILNPATIIGNIIMYARANNHFKKFANTNVIS
jgi:hypothetical protein